MYLLSSESSGCFACSSSSMSWSARSSIQNFFNESTTSARHVVLLNVSRVLALYYCELLRVAVDILWRVILWYEYIMNEINYFFFKYIINGCLFVVHATLKGIHRKTTFNRHTLDKRCLYYDSERYIKKILCNGCERL